MSTRQLAYALIVASALTVAACSSNDPQTDATTTPYPSGTVVVEPLRTIPGAERIDVDGVGIDLVPGYVSTPAGNQPDQTVVQIHKDGDTLGVLTLSVTRLSHPVTDDDAEIGFDAFHQFAPFQRGVTDIVDFPVAWDAVAHPLGLRAVEHPTAQDALDLRWLGGREPDGDRLVSVQVWSELDTDVETSDAWQMVRTIRFDSSSGTTAGT